MINKRIEGSTPAIAVIGMSCWYPGANNLLQLWENILSRRQQFRQIPDQRLPLSEYYDPDPLAPDKTYGTRAAVIDGFEFDWVAKRIPKIAFASTDIVHWLALEVALKALDNAGYKRTVVSAERSGVVLGNTLTGEQWRTNLMRLRWPYVRKALRASAAAKGLPEPLVNELVETMEECYKSAFPPVTEDTLAGELSNTIAGRICNYLNFNGGGYTVDGACSSSLIAIATAASSLVNGELDLALAGGVDVALDTVELIGFAKTGALTAQDMRVYDRRASGFIPGEGCGFVVLKRLEDARADGDYIYAVLRGWGISSDGKGGITAPNRVGQSLALRRAYAGASYNLHHLDFIEGHGTGTPVGDRNELEGIAIAMEADGKPAPRSCGITSFKSLVGHTKAAAGVGGFIKTVMALNRRVIPPTAGCQEPNPVFESTARCIYPILLGEVRGQSETLRAGVSAMGFGGINCHVTLESGDPPSSQIEPAVEERALLVSNQETELFVLGAPSTLALIKRVQYVKQEAKGLSLAELIDLAAHLSRELEQKSIVRASVIASSPEELVQRLHQLEIMLEEVPPAEGEVQIDPEKTIWIGNAVEKNRVAFLFPGQGSQQLNMSRKLVERYKWARDLVAQTDQWLQETGLSAVSPLMFRPLDQAVDTEQIKKWSAALAQTSVAQPAICLSSILWANQLERLGIRPVAVGGHSLGELTAFHIAGAFDTKTLLCLAAVRGQAMSIDENQVGIMASLGCSQSRTESILQQVSGYVEIANINSPNQTVISGERSSVEEAITLAKTNSIQTHLLQVSNAFHSQLVASAGEYLRKNAVMPEVFEDTDIQLFSSVDGRQVTTGCKLQEHFARQVVAQVDFITLVKNLSKKCDLIVEVGSGKILSGLVSQIDPRIGDLCLPIESKTSLDQDFNTVLAMVFVCGSIINWEALYEKRCVLPFIPTSARIFIENPCEKPFDISSKNGPSSLLISKNWNELRLIKETEISPQVMSSYLAQRGGFLAEVIRADLRTLSSFTGTQDDNSATRNHTIKPPFLGSNSALTAGERKSENLYTILTAHQQTETIEKILVNLVSEQTGYPIESIALESRLLDDLNLDSIKAGELVTALAKECGVAGKIDSTAFANASLKEIYEAIQSILPESDFTLNANGQKTALSHLTPNSITTISNLLMELVEQQTGFPRSGLSMDLRLLDDLNLDSIKAGEFVAEAAKRVEVQGQLDPSQFANATLAEVADVLQQFVREKSLPAAQAFAPKVFQKTTYPNINIGSNNQQQTSWVRNFVIDYVAEKIDKLPSEIQLKQWKEATVLIFCEPEEKKVAETLSKALCCRGAKTKIACFAEVHGQIELEKEKFSHAIAVLPQFPNSEPLTAARLQKAIKRLHSVAALRQSTTVAYIQFGGGYFGSQARVASIEQCCANAFASSSHLESSGLKIRVIDLPSGVNENLAAECIISELNAPDGFIAAGYDEKLIRRVPRPRLQELGEYRRRAIDWSAQDVILVTGGAKGITGECVLALAKATGVRTALVGSSPYPQHGSNSDILGTLERFKAEKLICQYYQCNITDAEQVNLLIQQVRQELGEITGVIHGAGLNRPKRTDQVTVEAAQEEVSPKVLGAINLCNALQGKPPKLFVGFSSIISITGMLGNSWYGFSNEALNIILRQFQLEHPGTATLSIAFSVWGEVGMGTRMGSIDNLNRMGINAISTDEGVRRFLHLVENEADEHQVIVTARLGNLDTWRPKRFSLPVASRFLEKIIYAEPLVEVISRVHLTTERDAYVRDHIYKGSYLFPTVFGLEAMSQVVAYVTGEQNFNGLVIENVCLERPIVVDPKNGLDIEIRAEVLEHQSNDTERRIQVGITTEQTGFNVDHFSATFVLGIIGSVSKERIIIPETVPLDIEPQTDLYSWLLFQGPLFQRLQQIYVLDSKQCVFRAQWNLLSSRGDACNSSQQSHLLLGDPFFRDSLLQSAQLVIPQDLCLPVRIDRIDLYQLNENVPDSPICVALYEGREGRQYKFTVFALDDEGHVVERLSGYRLQLLEHREQNPTVEDLVTPSQRDEETLRRELQHRCAKFHVTAPEISIECIPGLHSLSATERHCLELPLFHRTVNRLLKFSTLAEHPIQVKWLESGKPMLEGLVEEGIEVSLSHDDSVCFCTVGWGWQGCDIAPVTPRTREEWKVLLATARELLMQQLITDTDSVDRAGTRIWAAVEALRKATNAVDIDIAIYRWEGDSVLFQCLSLSEPLYVLTFPVRLTRGYEKLLALVVHSDAVKNATTISV